MTSPSRVREREDPGEEAPGGTQGTPGGIQGVSRGRAQVQRVSPSTCTLQDRQVSTVTNGSRASSTKRAQWKVEGRQGSQQGRHIEEGLLPRCRCQALITEMNQQKKITSMRQSKKRLGWEPRHLHPFHPRIFSLQLSQDGWWRGGTVRRV